MEDTTRKADMLRKIRAMLDRAEHPNTPPEEADTARRMADEMMLRYSIEEYELAFARPAQTREKPILRTIRYFENSAGVDGDVMENISTIFWYLARYCRVKIGFYGYGYSKVVGFERDLDLLDMMFTQTRLHISSTVDPKVSRNLPWVQNMALLKEAGKKWKDIHEALDQADLEDYPYKGRPWGENGRPWSPGLTKAYTDYCKQNGSSRMYDSPMVWKRSFVRGYVQEVITRIQRMEASNNDLRESKAVVLASMTEDLQEALYENFPHLRPHPDTCDCDQCHYNKCQNRMRCTRKPCADARKPIRGRTARLHEVRLSEAGINAGRSAGATLDLSKGSIGDRKGELR